MWDSRLRETLPAVRERIQRALDRAGRDGDVQIVAVTKGHPVEAVEAAVRAGLVVVGENRVQELEEKVAAVGRDTAEWHMIGHLQRNKARQAVLNADWIHSLDSLRLARALSKEAKRADLMVRGYMQVNVSGEGSKGGIGAEEAVDVLGAMAELENIEVHGLMTMAPFTDDAGILHRTFGEMRKLGEVLQRDVPGALQGSGLSMGMSNDFEIAIEEGATSVRLGTVLFGERSYS